MTTMLAIEIAGDASDAAAAFDDVGDAAVRMSDDVDRASAAAGDSVDRFSAAGEAADDMASKSAQAAGGIGDLGGALALMPGPLGAVGAGMEAVGPAIMGVTGASDLLNLVTRSNIVLQTKAKAAAIASAVASRTQAVATKATTIAQKALNLAMRANPIGLAITSAIALVGLFVLLYRRSENFRRIVQAVMRAAQAAFRWVIDKAIELGRRVADMTGRISNAIREAVGWVRDRLGGAFTWMRDKALGALNAVRDAIGRITGAIRGAIGWVRDLVGKIDDIKLPDLNPFGRMSFAAASWAPATDSGGFGFYQSPEPTQIVVQGETYEIKVDQLTDTDDLVVKLDQAAARRASKLSAAVATVR